MSHLVLQITEDEFFANESTLRKYNILVFPNDYAPRITNAKHFYFKAYDSETNKVVGLSAFCKISNPFQTEFYHRAAWVDESVRGKGVWKDLFFTKLNYINSNNLANSVLNFHTVAVAEDDTRYTDWMVLKNTVQKTDTEEIKRVWYYVRHEQLLEKYSIIAKQSSFVPRKESMLRSASRFHYTQNNHFKFGYNNVAFSERSSKEDKWFVEYGRNSYTPGSLKEEAVVAAKHIRRVNTGEIDILFSGGSDSEIVLKAFIEAGIEVNCHIMRYDKYINAHDWVYATVICDSLGITPIYHDLDLIDFYESGEYKKYSDFTNCVTPQLLPHMWLMNRVRGVPVMGSGECYTARIDIAANRQTDYRKNPYSKDVKWVLYEREKIASWYRFPMKMGRAAVPGFFQYTPELMYAFLNHPISRNLHSNNIIGKLSNKSSKLEIYLDNYPEMIDRPKYSGFESIELYDVHLRRQLREDNRDYEYEHWSEVSKLLSYMEGKGDFPENIAPSVPCPGFYDPLRGGK